MTAILSPLIRKCTVCQEHTEFFVSNHHTKYTHCSFFRRPYCIDCWFPLKQPQQSRLGDYWVSHWWDEENNKMLDLHPVLWDVVVQPILDERKRVQQELDRAHKEDMEKLSDIDVDAHDQLPQEIKPKRKRASKKKSKEHVEVQGKPEESSSSTYPTETETLYTPVSPAYDPALSCCSPLLSPLKLKRAKAGVFTSSYSLEQLAQLNEALKEDGSQMKIIDMSTIGGPIEQEEKKPKAKRVKKDKTKKEEEEKTDFSLVDDILSTV
jgi:hypothetical protein